MSDANSLKAAESAYIEAVKAEESAMRDVLAPDLTQEAWALAAKTLADARSAKIKAKRRLDNIRAFFQRR